MPVSILPREMGENFILDKMTGRVSAMSRERSGKYLFWDTPFQTFLDAAHLAQGRMVIPR